VGFHAARNMSVDHALPFVAVHHLEAHILTARQVALHHLEAHIPTARQVAASERRGITLNEFEDFYLKVKVLTVLCLPYSLDSGHHLEAHILKARQVAASERRGEKIKAFEGFYLKFKASVWPLDCFLCAIFARQWASPRSPRPRGVPDSQPTHHI